MRRVPTTRLSIPRPRTAVCGVACTSGCLTSRVTWRAPNYLPPLKPAAIPSCGAHGRAERIYAKALNREECCRSSCVDLYFEAARLTAYASQKPCFCRDRQLHESALMKMVVTGQCFKRFKASSGLTIYRKGEKQFVPINRHNFVWQPSDFGKLVPIGFYETSEIKEKFQRRGVGVPFVVNRINSLERPFMRGRGAFPSTLVLQAGSTSDCNCKDGSEEVKLDLYDTLRVDTINIDGKKLCLSKDNTAPFVYMLQGQQQLSYLTYFINPSRNTVDSGLSMLEPYQKNKIPIVLIHGLLSDPFTWVELANRLYEHPGFVENFQLWAFDYSTGNSILLSASALREQLAGARQYCDPSRSNPKMADMLLIGHSMGGLLAKLQVTSSGNELWNAIASRPFNEVKLSESVREELQHHFFFTPSPDVTRVVFMATPHKGSGFAGGPMGRISAALINRTDAETQQHSSIIRSNPGVFSKEVRRRIPTSIDMLNPHSQLLKSIDCLPVSERVQMHSIIGDKCWTLLRGKSDGIVPVSSAKEARVVSEKIVKATHTGVKANPESVKEILYILQDHLQQSVAEPYAPSILSQPVAVRSPQATKQVDTPLR